VSSILLAVVLAPAAAGQIRTNDRPVAQHDKRYVDCIRQCLDLLIEHGTDRYGKSRAPILVSILDVQTRDCPENPERLDEAWRVIRRERRNPAGANLLTDQPLLKTMYALSAATGDEKYAAFARAYTNHYMKNLVDEKGFFWWGWHRHYDVFKDTKSGHAGNHHEIHAINGIDWESLWDANAEAVRMEIEAIWRWHVVDKKTGEINRHGDGRRGCDFSMSAGAFVEAFAFLYTKTRKDMWLDRAKLLSDYYWTRRNPKTGNDKLKNGQDVFYRIPAITVATDGTILAFANGRVGTPRDHCPYVQLVLRRSKDNGKTWGPKQVLFDRPGWGAGGCPAVTDPVTGEIMFEVLWQPASAEARRAYAASPEQKELSGTLIARSRDSGETWKFEKMITEPNHHGMIGFSGGSGRKCVLTHLLRLFSPYRHP